MVKQGRKKVLLISLIGLIYNALVLGVYQFAGIRHGMVEYLTLVVLISTGTFLMIRFFIKPKQMEAGKLTKVPKKRDGDTRGDKQFEELMELKEMERYRKDFLGNVSHELKTPIFNIQGYLLTLLDGAMDDENINRLYLKRAEKSINRLNSIVEDLDSITRLESGEFKMNVETFNLVKVVEEIIVDYEIPARQRNIRISFEGSHSKAVRVKADRRLIVEVIENLVSNSIKYGKEGGKTTISLNEKGKRLIVSVKDNGIGIAEKDLPRIFERFFRVDKSRSRESGGTGLGLSIVKHTLQAHHQDISVQSKVGSGSTFTFSLNKAE